MSAADRQAFAALLKASPPLAAAWTDFDARLTTIAQAGTRATPGELAGLRAAANRVLDRTGEDDTASDR